jgi:hypothetical protein
MLAESALILGFDILKASFTFSNLFISLSIEGVLNEDFVLTGFFCVKLELAVVE